MQHKSFALSRKNPNRGIDIMHTILSLDMAGEKFGHWIKNNQRWKKLNLPKPSHLDLCKSNKEQRQWRHIQKDLNAALDQLAGQSTNPASDVQVNLYGLGDTSNTSLDKIYQDLFSQQIFNNSSSNWSDSHQINQAFQGLNL